jgi:uncharacterized membrane protein YfhO
MNRLCLNDAQMQDFYSSTSYHQFNNVYYVRFLQKMNVISDTLETETRWITGLGGRPALMQLVSNKYMVCNGPPGWLATVGYDSVTTVNGIRVYKNHVPLPLGFTYDGYITEKEMVKIGYHKDVMMLNAVVLDSTVSDNDLRDLRHLTPADTVVMDTLNINRTFADLRQDSFRMTYFSQNRIAGDINVSKRKVLFFSIPYSKGWQTKIDGKDVKPLMVNFGFIGYILEPGTHKVELNFEPPYYTAGMEASAAGFAVFVGLCTVYYFTRRKKTAPANTQA